MPLVCIFSGALLQQCARVCVQVFAALKKADSLLHAADHEIFVGCYFGRPFYLPRAFAYPFCAQHRRRFPHAHMHRLCSAVRGVARVQLSLLSLFQDGVSNEVVLALQQTFPAHLLPLIVRSSADALEVWQGPSAERRGMMLLGLCMRLHMYRPSIRQPTLAMSQRCMLVH